MEKNSWETHFFELNVIPKEYERKEQETLRLTQTTYHPP